MLYFQFSPDALPSSSFNSADDLWKSLSSLSQFSSTIDQQLWRLIQLNELQVEITESDLVNVLSEKNNNHILDLFSSTTWALLHVAYDRCSDKSEKKLFSKIKCLFDSTLNNIPCCLFLLSQFDFDINQNRYVSENIMLSQNGWAQWVLLSLPEFELTRVNPVFLRDQLDQKLNDSFCEFIKLTYTCSV